MSVNANTHPQPPAPASASGRGRHLVDADRGFLTGGLIGRTIGLLPTTLFEPVVRRFDSGLAKGTLTATLPNGSVRKLGGRADGVAADVTIHSWASVIRLMVSGSVGWFRALQKGEWSTTDNVALLTLFSQNAISLGKAARARGPVRWFNAARHMMRDNDRAGSRRNIAAHYDLGNDFYAAWLDPSMTYSCAIFAPGNTLEQAQQAKMDAILGRIHQQPGSSMLEIGCGWGALGKRAIDRLGVDYSGLTLSAEQADWARRLIGDDSAIRIEDYRDHHGSYDSIASVEMVEAVGQRYWPDYLDAIARLLKPGGRAAIQYIAIDDVVFDAYVASADFIQTYIFPGGCLLSESRFRALAEARGLQWADHHRFSDDYAETLAQWRRNYDQAVAANRLPAGFDESFHQLWRYYLDYCEGGFRGGNIWVAQVTLAKGEV